MASAPRRWALWAESIILCFEASTLSASSEERLIKYGACTESLTPSLLASLPTSSACLGGMRTPLTNSTSMALRPTLLRKLSASSVDPHLTALGIPAVPRNITVHNPAKHTHPDRKAFAPRQRGYRGRRPMNDLLTAVCSRSASMSEYAATTALNTPESQSVASSTGTGMEKPTGGG